MLLGHGTPPGRSVAVRSYFKQPFQQIVYIFNVLTNPLFLKKTTNDVVDVYKKDLEFVRKLQEDVIKYVNMQLIKTALDQRLKSSVIDFRSEAALSEIFSVMTLDLLNSGKKGGINGND